jgi:hypothetical protein
VKPTEPLPDSLAWLRERAAGLVKRKPDELDEKELRYSLTFRTLQG